MDVAALVAAQATSALHCREFVLSGRRSGKSRWAEDRAQAWLAQFPGHRFVLIPTARASDDAMRQRILRHQADRARRVPSVVTIEEPLHLARTITAQSDVHTLVVVDCVTLWLTNLLMPLEQAERVEPDLGALQSAIAAARGPLVLIGNEIGLGVIPMGREVREFVDVLRRTNQTVAKACDRITFLVAGLPLTLKELR